MTVVFRNPVRLPRGIIKELDAYTEEGEEIIDILMETLILAIDFRWLILTSMRVIIATEKFMSVDFKDVHFDGIDMQLTKGFFYDNLHIKSMTDDYNAQFYAFNRARTEQFLQGLETERDIFQKEKKKGEKLVEQEAMEELGAKGPLDEPRKRKGVIYDIDHNENVLDPRIAEAKAEDLTGEGEGGGEGENNGNTESPPEKPVHEIHSRAAKKIEELMILRNEGAITEEEFEKKKERYLKDL